mmetsp:Transcript_12905/g.42064  ORF Transcript_12905/g.42064 Transcript_12905/m.42064 type:complete len:336 (-) Transcript_12905:88-1095(-)
MLAKLCSLLVVTGASALRAGRTQSIRAGSALKATGDRWYEGQAVKYPRGAADMPASPPEETGGGGHDPKLFAFWKKTDAFDYEVSLARPLGIVFEELGPPNRPQGVKVIEVQPESNAAKDGGVGVGDVLVGAGDVLVEDEEDEETSDTRVLKCWTTTTTEPTLRAAEPRPPPWSESVEYQRKRSADEAFAADAQEGFDDAVAVAAARGSKIEELLQELRKAAADPRDFLQPAHTLCGDYLAGAGAPDHSAPFDFQPSSAVDFAAIAADALAMCDAAERKADKTVRDMTSDAFKTALKKAKIDYKGKKHEDLHVALVNYYALHQKYDPAELFPKPS